LQRHWRCLRRQVREEVRKPVPALPGGDETAPLAMARSTGARARLPRIDPAMMMPEVDS
jgi:hypothetical protein